ncbi:MAG: lytic murein transglycosylase [Thiotrichales bacterium]
MRDNLPTLALMVVLAGCHSHPAREAVAADREGVDVAATESSALASLAERPSTQLDAEAMPDDFVSWLAGFRREARAAGIAESTLARALDGIHYRPRVIELDRSQPEFVRPIWQYLDAAVSEQRVAQGRTQLNAHRETIRHAEQRYGVPGEIIVAIWGIESNYGGNFGSFATLDALATLAYEGRRRDFARGELLAALRIIERGDIEPERMIGSWAGAMGHTQFIPSSFVAYAVDGDQDGRRDIWNSIPDVVASTANYLARSGWRRGQSWAVEVRLPNDFNHAETELSVRRSSRDWAAMGVRAVDSGTLPEFDAGSVIVPAGARGPAFLVGPNHRAILRYNNATSYALAVGILADRIAGRAGVTQGWPRDEQPLARGQVRELQRLLNARGFDVGVPDGVLGPNTRDGLRAFQRAIGVTPDGFATLALLERLRR